MLRRPHGWRLPQEPVEESRCSFCSPSSGSSSLWCVEPIVTDDTSWLSQRSTRRKGDREDKCLLCSPFSLSPVCLEGVRLGIGVSVFEKKSRLPTRKTHCPAGREVAVPGATMVNGARSSALPSGARTSRVRTRVCLGRGEEVWQPGRLHELSGMRRATHPNRVSRSVQRGTGHAEVVLVVFDPRKILLRRPVRIFWESHDPTQACDRERRRHAVSVRDYYSTTSSANCRAHARAPTSHSCRVQVYAPLRRKSSPAPEFYYAEDYHQQYLSKILGLLRSRGTAGPARPASK